MPAVCSTCSHVSDGSGPCPRCGAALGGDGVPTTPMWQQTGWGRVLIGLVVGQGLFYGLKQLLTAGLLAYQGGTSDELWLSAPNVITLGCLQLLAVLAGGMLAGGGQNGGFGLGAIAGAWNGVLAVLLNQLPGDTLGTSALYALPAAHAVVGAAGGLIGVLVWRPVSLNPEPDSAPRKIAPRKSRPLLAGPVVWLRCIVGAAIAVAGSLYAGGLLDYIAEVSRGRLVPTSTMQDNVLTWELRAIAMLLGGAFAGVMTRNGLKQGLVVGVMAAIALIGVQSAKGGAWMELAFFTAVGTMSLSLAGGWFGGQLLPPVVAVQRRTSPQV